MKTIRRMIHPETRVLDAKTGLVEYVASDETLDAYKEVIRANGWRFDLFHKNAPFVDSHRYESVESLVGKVVDFRVEKGRLVETAQWAIDVPENTLAQLGFKMTAAGYLKAVSVGFWPTKVLTKLDGSKAEHKGAWDEQLRELGLDEESAPRRIYLEQQQVELSACIVGANPNALARAFKDALLEEKDLAYLDAAYRLAASEQTTETAVAAGLPADAAAAHQRACLSLQLTSVLIRHT